MTLVAVGYVAERILEQSFPKVIYMHIESVQKKTIDNLSFIDNSAITKGNKVKCTDQHQLVKVHLIHQPEQRQLHSPLIPESQ